MSPRWWVGSFHGGFISGAGLCGSSVAPRQQLIRCIDARNRIIVFDASKLTSWCLLQFTRRQQEACPTALGSRHSTSTMDSPAPTTLVSQRPLLRNPALCLSIARACRPNEPHRVQRNIARKHSHRGLSTTCAPVKVGRRMY
jgi:hypothetical protein